MVFENRVGRMFGIEIGYTGFWKKIIEELTQGRARSGSPDLIPLAEA